MGGKLSFYRDGKEEIINVRGYYDAVNVWRAIKYEEGDDVYSPCYLSYNGSVERIWDNS